MRSAKVAAGFCACFFFLLFPSRADVNKRLGFRLVETMGHGSRARKTLWSADRLRLNLQPCTDLTNDNDTSRMTQIWQTGMDNGDMTERRTTSALRWNAPLSNCSFAQF